MDVTNWDDKTGKNVQIREVPTTSTSSMVATSDSGNMGLDTEDSNDEAKGSNSTSTYGSSSTVPDFSGYVPSEFNSSSIIGDDVAYNFLDEHTSEPYP